MSLEDDRRRVSVGPGDCPSLHTWHNKVGRLVWGMAWAILFRPTPRCMDGWRRFLLRCFGARIGKGTRILGSARIWAPWNLVMGEYACLSEFVDCYCVDRIRVGAHATVSQYAFLCTASHDVADPHMKLVTAPIVIGDQAWVAADVFIGPGVHLGTGCVVGARSSVFKDLPAWKVCMGTPARPIRDRTLTEARVS
jgi:putative colanic acid biosynthesis acetyltransferase WcaF